MLVEETAAKIGVLARQENAFSVSYELEGAGR